MVIYILSVVLGTVCILFAITPRLISSSTLNLNVGNAQLVIFILDLL